LKLLAHNRILTALSLLVLLLPVAPAYACSGCDEPVIVDATEAYDRSIRDERDDVEGLWGIYIDWQPVQDAGKRYRMAVVKNNYGVYEGTDYLGVVTCDQPGCNRGEVKLLLQKTDDEKKFYATLLVTDFEGGYGIAVLGPHERTGREDSMLDLSALRYKGAQLTYGMVRVMGG